MEGGRPENIPKKKSMTFSNKLLPVTSQTSKGLPRKLRNIRDQLKTSL